MSESKGEPMADQDRDEHADPTVNAGSHEPATPSQAETGAADARADQDQPATPHGEPRAEAAPGSGGGGHIMVLPPVRAGEWRGDGEDRASAQGPARSRRFGKRRLGAMAAIFALAAVAGVVGGSLAFAAFGHLFSGRTDSATAPQVQALEQTITKLNAEIAALKTSTERAAKADAAQLAKITDRVEKAEKAQAEPAAKIARLSETVEKLRVSAAAPAPAPAAKEVSRETTASIPTPVAAPNRTAEASRLPTVQGWRLRDIANGGALVEGQRGLYEVYAGDPLPGLGRVDAIRKQDGRWVVVTSKGLIVAR